MALTSKSQFCYGFEVNAFNNNLTFSIGAGTLVGALTYGFYTLESLATEVTRVLTLLAPAKVFTYSINRTASGPYITFTCTPGPTFSLDFSQPASIGPTMGFNATNHTGSTSYTSENIAGTVLQPEQVGYTYLGPEFTKQIMGAVNISTTGLKEAVVFNLMQFIQVEFKYEPQAKVIAQWEDFWDWAIQQRPFEFTPQVSDPSTVYQVTLEKTATDGKGLGFKMTEMLPEFPFYFKTGIMTMRRQLNPTYII